MEFKTYEDVVQFAIEREEEAIRAYGDMSEKAGQPGLKRLFAELRDEEKKHRQLLQSMSPERIAHLKLKPVTDLKISDYLVEETLDEEMTFQDLLIFAAQKEQRSVKLYSELAGRTGDADLKKMFLFMAEQEQGHKLKLEKEYDEHVLMED